jgi:hypothetical protein
MYILLFLLKHLYVTLEVTTLQFALIFEIILAVKAVVGSIIVTEAVAVFVP